jgi:DNA-binding MarR family transcriptional regulator
MENAALSFRLMQAFFRLHRQKHRTSPVQGINPGELRALRCLKKFDSGQGVMVSQLSAQLGVTPPFVTQMTNNLVQKGLVNRSRDPADRRAVRLQVTPRGKDTIDKASAELSASFQGLAEHLGPEQSEALIGLLDRACKFFEEGGTKNG